MGTHVFKLNKLKMIYSVVCCDSKIKYNNYTSTNPLDSELLQMHTTTKVGHFVSLLILCGSSGVNHT